mgnify:CR=1 FL=1
MVIRAVLIGIALLGQEPRSFIDVFDAAPTPELPVWFADLGDTSAAVVADWLTDGALVPAVTPQAMGPRIAEHIDQRWRVGKVLEIHGTICNNTASTTFFSQINSGLSMRPGLCTTTRTLTGPPFSAAASFAFHIPVPPSRKLTMKSRWTLIHHS